MDNSENIKEKEALTQTNVKDSPQSNEMNGHAKELNCADKVDDKEDDKEDDYGKSWFNQFKDEMRIDKHLIPIKIFSFLFYGGMYAFAPYYILHMQQLGLTVKEIAVMYSVLPIPAIIGPIISGLVADWTSNFKAVLVVNIVLSIVFNIATVFTPLTPVAMPSVAFSVDGVALQRWAAAGPDLTRLQMDEWSCQSDCLPDLGLNHTHPVYCAAYNLDSPIPLEDCTLVHSSTMDQLEEKNVEFSAQSFAASFGNSSWLLSEAASKQCSMACDLQVMTSHQPPDFSNSRTFWIYFLLRIIGKLFVDASFSMLDASIMAILLRKGGDYGKQRLVAMISLAIFPFLSSYIVSVKHDPALGGPDYSYVFYLSTVILIVCIFSALFVEIKVEASEKRNVLKELKELLKKVEVDVFLVIIFLLGANWGFLENYLFVYLTFLKAPTYMLGLTMTFGCLVGVPMLIVSDRIVERLGRSKIFFIGFLAYTVRMFGYSFITNPWLCFIFEALEVFTYQIMWVAAVTYYPILAPTSLLGTLSGIAGSVHYNIGRGGGAFIGGFLIANIGMVWTFRVFGTLSFVSAVFYFLLQKFYLDKVIEKNAAKRCKYEEAKQVEASA